MAGHEIVDPHAIGPIGDVTPSPGRFGSESNYLDIDSGGVLTLAATAKRTLMLRSGIDVITQIAKAKPTQIVRGVNKGFSMPIWDSGGNADEQLFLYACVPNRWDGISDLSVCILVVISDAEDVGDRFNFQVSWDSAYNGSVLSATSVDSETETIVLADRAAAWNAYRVEFTIDHDTAGHLVTRGGLFSWRLRRIAASASEVTNEIIVLASAVTQDVDKMFGD